MAELYVADVKLGEEMSGGGKRVFGWRRLPMVAAIPGAKGEAMEVEWWVVPDKVEKEVAMLWERAERLSPEGRAMERGGSWEEDEEGSVGRVALGAPA